MRTVEIGVTYRKQVSDGNYGTESAEVHLLASTESSDVDEMEGLTELMLQQACTSALAQLSKSLSANVRRAVEPAKRYAPPESAPIAEPEEIPF